MKYCVVMMYNGRWWWKASVDTAEEAGRHAVEALDIGWTRVSIVKVNADDLYCDGSPKPIVYVLATQRRE